MNDELAAALRRVAPNINLDAVRDLPAYSDRRAGAEAVTRFLFPIAPRTLQGWPLTWRQINGRACCLTADLLAAAVRKLEGPAARRGTHGFAHRKAPTTAAAAAAVTE